MRPRLPIIRNTVKWGSLLLGAAVLALWVWSGSHWMSVARTARWELNIDHGCLYVTDLSPPTVFGWMRVPPPEAFHWWFGRRQLTWEDSTRYYPLWPAAALPLGISAVAWLLDARARRCARMGFCPRCGYDRAGIALAALCPECGKVP